MADPAYFTQAVEATKAACRAGETADDFARRVAEQAKAELRDAAAVAAYGRPSMLEQD